MGGSGSGQWGGRPTVEGSLALDVNRLLRDGTLQRGASTWGTLAWRNSHSGEQTASMGYSAALDPERGHLHLRWSTANRLTGERQSREQRVELVTTPQPLGGRRWWFLCPRTGDLVSKLFLPSGASAFASRKAYRLAYRSQRQSPFDRAISQAFKRRQRLGATGGIGDPVEKPKGMRWATFDRHMERVEAAELVCDGHLLRFVRQLGR